MNAKHKKTASSRESRKASLGDETRAALIEKAEVMFAEKGIDGVSLRQIGIAAGSANANVVGYHFGTKESLVKATLMRGRPTIEARRAELLTQARRDGRDREVSALIEALCRPIFEHRNASGRHTYAIFLWHISRSGWWERLSYTSAFPATQELIRRLAAALPQLTDSLFMERMRAVADVITGVLQRLDSHLGDDRRQEMLFGHALRMAEAVLAVPCIGHRGKPARSNPAAPNAVGALDPLFELPGA